MADVDTKRLHSDAIFSVDCPDAWLEAVALSGPAAAYTQFGLCTVSLCPGIKAKADATAADRLD